MKTTISTLLATCLLTSSAFAEGKIKNPSAGNDRIIFSAQHNRSDAFTEGLEYGGGALNARRQCEHRRKHYEEVYGAGACNRVCTYAPGSCFFDQLFEDIIFWFIAVPVITAGTLVASCVGVCAYYKLKKD